MLVTGQLVVDLVQGTGDVTFELQIAIWLWLTVLFANFAEALAEGRGKAQADALRTTRTTTVARKLVERRRGADAGSGPTQGRPRRRARPGDMIPTDGEIVEGIASVDESAITGESAPVIREAGGDRLGHRRHARALRPDRHPHHRRSRARRSSTA